MHTMINLVIHGHTGRLAKRIIENLKNNENIKYVGFIDRLYDFTILAVNTNIIILDITSDIGCRNLIKKLLEKELYYPLIVGTTGALPKNLIELYANNSRVYEISNFSHGIKSILNVLPSIKIPNGCYEISETHHIHKKDMPSGTAKSIAKQIDSNYNFDDIKSIREDSVHGIHETIIENDYERIVIRHEVKDPNVFAIGCIQYINQINLDRTIAGYLKI
jgi:4-hydroxy-tetrahydrodipicolinate reductase